MPGWPQLGTSGSSCMAIPMPWPVYSFTTEKPAASATPWTAAPMSDEPPPGCIGLDAGDQRRLRDVDEPLRLGVDLPHPGGEGGVAVPALDDRPAVDRDEVALLQPVRARDAVHDHVVGGRADHAGERRVAVAEEVGPGAPALDDVATDAIELRGGDAGTDGLPDARRASPPRPARPCASWPGRPSSASRPQATRPPTVRAGGLRRWRRRGGR